MDDFEEDYYEEQEDNENNIYTEQVKEQVINQGAKAALKEGTKETVKKTVQKKVVEKTVKESIKKSVNLLPGVGQALYAGLEVADAARKLAKKHIEKRKKENEQQKAERKIKQLVPFIIILGIILLPAILAIGFFSIGIPVTTHDSVGRLNEFIECMSSNKTCSEITDLKLEEELKGYNKPLILFNKKELKEVSEKYSKFSDKYFESGEGLFNDDYEDVKENFGLSEDYKLKKEELDAAVLANFLTLEARAFSEIDWYEVTWDDEKKAPVEKKITDFDIIYDSSKDTSGEINWFSWFNKNEDYVIKIPSVKKYGITKRTTQVISSKTTTTNLTTGTSSTVTSSDSEPQIEQTPTEEQITEEYLKKELMMHRSAIIEYLPQWYEPYATYLADGDVESAKEVYQKYLQLYKDGNYKIIVKLYAFDDKIQETTVTETDTTSSIEGEGTTQTHTVSEVITETRLELFKATVHQGLMTKQFLAERVVDYYKVYDIKKPTKYTDPPPQSGTSKNPEGKTVSYYTDSKEKKDTLYLYQLPPEDVKNNNGTSYYSQYPDLIFGDDSDRYSDNEYCKLRLAFVYFKVCQDRKVQFAMDDIGPALEVVKDYYKKTVENKSNNSTVTSQNGGGTYSRTSNTWTN